MWVWGDPGQPVWIRMSAMIALNAQALVSEEHTHKAVLVWLCHHQWTHLPNRQTNVGQWSGGGWLLCGVQTVSKGFVYDGSEFNGAKVIWADCS